MEIFNVGDTIRFKRTYQRRIPSKIVSTPGSARSIVEPAIEEQILKQGGEGAIIEIHKSPRKVKRITRGGNVKVDVVHTAKVHAGPGLGYVAAVLDDAVLTAKQHGLFDMAPVEERAANVYGTEGKVS